jgi:two-component system, cell cycle sensor histidine kinase and response regulator CckA
MCEFEHSSRKVLVMDDDEMIRELLEQILTAHGYKVEVAEEGEQAVELYKRALASGQAFDLLILDLTIPGGIGGREALRRIKMLDHDVKAIACSGYSADGVMSHYQEYGFSAALAKPFAVDDLIAALQKCRPGKNELQ